LRDAGAAPEVVCEYLGSDEAALSSPYQLAQEKLAAVTKTTARGGES
jgi:hypothetical protein